MSSGVERDTIMDAADTFGGKEVSIMRLTLDFIVSVMAGVIANYISKWWGGDRRL